MIDSVVTTEWKYTQLIDYNYNTGFEINGCPVVSDNQNYDGATKLC